jgi:type VI secretion system protein ImpG
MIAPLLPHYERELEAFRTLGAGFAGRFPRLARRLRREPGGAPDPHVERMVEGFALLAARIHRQLDDGFPELAETLMEALFPLELRPVPAITILQLAPREGLRRSLAVPRHTPVLAPEVRGIRCGFRTARPVLLWPVAVDGASLVRTGPGAALTLELAAPPDLPFRGLGLDQLTLFLDGEPPLMHLLYELLLFRTEAVQLAAGPDGPVATLPGDAVRPAGLEPGEALLDDGPWIDPGARLLKEFFACPDAFMFVRLDGLARAPLAGPAHRLQVRFQLPRYGDSERHQRLARTLGPGNFRLGCVPAVNLFRRAAAPIRVTHRQPAYPVVPEGLRPEACEIYSIDSVTRVVPGAGADVVVPLLPLFAAGRPAPEGGAGLFWHASRGREGDAGTGPMELALAERDFQPVRPGPETLAVGLTCTNRDLPGQIPFGGGGVARADFLLPDQPEVPRARALRKPSPAHRPPDKQDLRQRLAAQLALARPTPGTGDASALRAALALHAPAPGPPAAGDPFAEGGGSSRPDPGAPIGGIAAFHGRPCTAWISGRAAATPVRGTEVTVTFDESRLAGSNLYLFATILERWFGQLCSPNTFVQFRMAIRQQEGMIEQWPARTAAGPLT